MFPMVTESRFAGLTGFIKNLLQQENPTDVSNLITQIYKEMKTLEEDGGRGPLDPQMEEYAVELWNWGVTKRGEEAITEMERSMVRHVACNLACWCEGSNQLETSLERNSLMAMKTGKGWIDVGKPERANVFLEIALNSLEKLYSMKIQRSALDTDMNSHKDWVEAEVFKVLTYQTEAAVAQKDFQVASSRIQRCKDMLLTQPNKAPLLSILCYNCGVEMYEGKEYEQSTFWLRQSCDISKADVRYTAGDEMEAKVLRLLATVYLEWDCKLHQDKALNAVALANEVNAKNIQ
ncbi:testis-expressed protein 11-like, partial [Rana temporaria]|uniref:testis-expressed protein 11-like n=1 Tax=Rana temporaria TaxID=8407 RepID=UPI001AAD02BC